LIQDFNTFCFDAGIKSEIILPKIADISSVRDMIYSQNLGQTLYEKNDGIKNFVDNKKPLSLNIKDIPFWEQIMNLYPDAITKNIDAIFLQAEIAKPYDFDSKKMIKNKELDVGYLKQYDPDEKMLQGFVQMIDTYTIQAQNDIEHQSNKIINQHTLGICLQTVESYFDTVTINQEDFAGDMKLSAQNISIDEKSHVVQIGGTIHGKSLIISYNLDTGEIHSQDFILANTWVVYVWDASWQQESLSFHWPKYDDIQKKSVNYLQKNIDQHLGGDFSSIDASLRKWLRNKVPVRLDAVLGRDIMEHTIEKNLTTKAIQQLINPWTPDGGAWSATINPEMWQLYTIFDKSMDWYTPAELRRLRGLVLALSHIIDPIAQNTVDTQDNEKDPLWIFLFNSKKLAQDKSNKTSDHNSFYMFFSSFTRNTNDLYLNNVLDLDSLTRAIMAYKMPGEKFPKNEQTKSLYEWQESSNKDPDSWLDKQLN